MKNNSPPRVPPCRRHGRTSRLSHALAWLAGGLLLSAGMAVAADSTKAEADVRPQPVIPSVAERFAAADLKESPDFGRHVIPLMGRLGCNGRACHGSFQGQGGFRLSLFGYDLKADHEALLKSEEPRTSVKEPEKSAILEKPTLVIPHEGGERMKAGSWEYRLLLSWIKNGAEVSPANLPAFDHLEVTPSEIHVAKKGEVFKLRAIAVWDDGRREDVTPLCRFQTNDETIAEINMDGVVTGGDSGDTHVVAFYDKAVVTVPVIRPVSDKVGPKYPNVPKPTEVDRLVVAKLQKMGMVPSELSTDAEFLRRVSLDTTGTLPTSAEVEAFLNDSTADKRERKIDELLERPAYAAWWATLFCDWTGNNAAQLNNVSPVQAAPAQDWYKWVEKRMAENMPYDQLVAGVVLAGHRDSDKSYLDYCREMSEMHHPGTKKSAAEADDMPYFWARRNLRQPEEKALAFAYSFMGLRIQCAQCHKHPFDVWTQDDYKQFQNFFTRISFGVNPNDRKDQQKLLSDLGLDGKKNGNDLRRQYADLLKEGKVVPFEGVYVAQARNAGNRPKNDKQNRKNPRPTFAGSARVLGGEMIELAEVDDPRVPLMDWLRSADNPYFARAIVNRVWANYFSVGIVDPPDDLSLANPPSNKELLDYLAQAFIEHNFDLKWLHREIARSRTYQLSWVPNETNKQDLRNFSRAIPRRIPAEVAYDALRQATASDKEVASLTENVDARAIGGAFAVNNRGNGNNTYALTVFGRSTRDSNCDCDRSPEPSLLQIVFLRNDESVHQMIDDRRTGWVAQVAGAPSPAARTEPDEGVARREARKLEGQVVELQKKLNEAKKADDQKQIKKLNRELALLRRDSAGSLKKARRNSEEAAKAKEAETPAKTWTAEEIVNQAYLRTLSRRPDAKETEASLAYLRGSASLAEGTRGLLWALLNTKEFIVNH